MQPLEPSLIFGIITAAGTFITIFVVIWNDGKTKGEIRQQITALQADVTRQNGNGSHLSDKVERMVEKDDCIRIHSDLTTSISEINGRFTNLSSERQQSEDRILTAIKKHQPTQKRERRTNGR